MIALLSVTVALAADVVWIAPADDAQRASVLAAARGRERTVLELRGAGAAFDADDERALRDLGAALADARAYEVQLDGELVIMRDLQGPVDDLGLLRDDADRAALFAVLAYQGFAVDRYFGDDLATAPAAAPYRADLNGVVIERPWLDAVAIEPDREVTAYDIAEAPQRIAYAEARTSAREVLPAALRPVELDGMLYVDGRAVTPGASGDVKVLPGRHLVHVDRQGHILQRWDLRVGPGDRTDLALDLDDATWNAFVRGLADGVEVPAGLRPSLKALGGEVWLARPGDRDPEVFAVTAEGVRAVEVEVARGRDDDDGAAPGSLDLAVLGGWTGSHDFYFQDPSAAPADGSTVNAASVGLSVGASLGLGPVRVGAGVDAWLPLGAAHVARYGDATTRVRPIPHLHAGLGMASVALGYALPYHPAVGLRGGVPLPGPLELRWLGWLGLPGEPARADGTTYTRRPLGIVGAGVGARL